jgi:hypothetical protein
MRARSPAESPKFSPGTAHPPIRTPLLIYRRTRDLAMFNLASIASFAAAMSWPVQRTGSVTSQALLGGTASFRRASYLNKVRDLGAARRTNGALNALRDMQLSP